MPIHCFNPLVDDRWAQFLATCKRASIFHSPEWVAALQLTYAYEPFVATSDPIGAALTNGVVFCRVKSVLTGTRLVSLPFSDHCEPLATSETGLQNLLSLLPEVRTVLGAGRFEIRPFHALPSPNSGFAPSAGYYSHHIDLRRPLAEVFRSFQNDSVRRKLRRAEGEHLSYEEGRSEKLISDFYRLLLLTRRRHRLPPQPIEWFRNLAACMRERMKVRVAYKHDRAVAAIVTLQFARSLVYKYGCSDKHYHSFGGMQMLFWRAIQEAIENRLEFFDLGRCELDNKGLSAFKERWGAQRALLSYWCTPASKTKSRRWNFGMLGGAFSLIPDRLLMASGKLLYKHVG